MSQGPLANIARIIDAKSRRVSSFDRTGGNADAVSIPKGECRTIAEIAGAGIIRHI